MKKLSGFIFGVFVFFFQKRMKEKPKKKKLQKEKPSWSEPP